MDTDFAHDLAAELNDFLDQGFDCDDAANIVWNRRSDDRLDYDDELTFSLDGVDIVVFNVHTERFTK